MSGTPVLLLFPRLVQGVTSSFRAQNLTHPHPPLPRAAPEPGPRSHQHRRQPASLPALLKSPPEAHDECSSANSCPCRGSRCHPLSIYIFFRGGRSCVRWAGITGKFGTGLVPGRARWHRRAQRKHRSPHRLSGYPTNNYHVPLGCV